MDKDLLIVLTILSLINLHLSVRFSDCGSKAVDVSKVEIVNCSDNMSRCNLSRGKDYVVKIHFYVKKTIPALTVQLSGKILGVEVPHLSHTNIDGCQRLKCPLIVGQNATYIENKVSVLQQYPKVRVDIIVRLVSPDKEVLLCIVIPSRIQ